MHCITALLAWLACRACGQHLQASSEVLQTSGHQQAIVSANSDRWSSTKRIVNPSTVLASLLLSFNLDSSRLGAGTLPNMALSLPHSIRSDVKKMRAEVSTLDRTYKTVEQASHEASGEGIRTPPTPEARSLERRLSKQMTQTCLDYNMIESGDHIMVCVSGGKDSATLLHLLLQLQGRLERTVPFTLTAVHLDQQQPGYNNTALTAWLKQLGVAHRIVSEDTYSVVKEKTPAKKAYCSLCSRLRRGILYSVASEISATKIVLGHHADDAAETLFLNMIHAGQMKGMPARYYSHSRRAHVMRPLITCLEEDIAAFAADMAFPILPCNLCGSQPDLQRGQVKMLLATLQSLTPTAKANLINAMSSVRPSHLLDQPLRASSGFDPITGQIRHPRATAIRGYEAEPVSPGETDKGDGVHDFVEDDPLLLL